MELPKNFTPLPASHFVRQFAIDLSELGIAHATIEDLREPSFWKEHADKFQAGDEIRVRGPSLDIMLRVVTTSPAGLIVEEAGSETLFAAAPRHLFVCRKSKASGNWCAVWAIGDPDADGFYGPGVKWEAFAPGQQNLPVLIDLVADAIDRRGPFDLTITSAELADVEQGYARLDEGRALLAARRPESLMTVFCPEGRTAADIWCQLNIHRRQGDVGSKFVVSQLSAYFRARAEEMRQDRLDPRKSSNYTKPWYTIDTIVRPHWQAVRIAPEDFASRVATPEADRLAQDHRKRKLAMAVPKHKRPQGWAADPNWWMNWLGADQ